MSSSFYPLTPRVKFSSAYPSASIRMRRGKGVTSVYSRNIKLAGSRLHHLPGLFLLFSMFMCFPATFKLLFFFNDQYKRQIWVCHIIIVQSTVMFPLPFNNSKTLESLVLIFYGNKNRTIDQ